MFDKILDITLEALERTKVFQDRKADRLQARADRKLRRAKTLEKRGKNSRAAAKIAEYIALQRRATRLRDE